MVDTPQNSYCKLFAFKIYSSLRRLILNVNGEKAMSHSLYLHLPVQTRKRCYQLYQQQMWAWGQDIRHADGNLLLKYGFRKESGPTPQNRASQYVLPVETDLAWKLWSFGTALESQNEGLLLPRHSFRPRWFQGPLQTQMTPQKIPKAQTLISAEKKAQSLKLIAINLHLFSKYENWILNTQGAAYRQEVMARWQEKARIPASEMAAEWVKSAQEVDGIQRLFKAHPKAA
jgi:hypothetical protein